MSAQADVGRSAQKVFRHYKKHYEDISSLFEMTGLQTPPAPQTQGQLPNNLLGLVTQADQSFALVKGHLGNIDQLAQIPAEEFQTNQPELCKALQNYRGDLEKLFRAIQTIRTKAPKPKKRARKGRTKKL